MRVQVITDGAAHRGVVLGAPPDAGAPSTYGAWRPERVLGASSPGGLALPDAKPSPSTLYAPRGVWIGPDLLVACDTGNHRVMLWHGEIAQDGADCDVVLGQRDADTEGAAADGAGPEHGLRLPTGVLVDQGRLVVADAWHHRILIWDAVPLATGTPPDHVLGQADLRAVEPNRGGDATADGMYWPFGIAVLDGRFYVADTGNRRVLAWRDGLPIDGRPADVVLGQPDPAAREENRGADVGPDSFRWPHALAGTGDGGLLVADAGNHRVLRWDVHPDADRPADSVLGQPDMVTGTEFPYVSQEGRLRFPYGLASGGAGLALADTANNRVLMWDDVPGEARAPDAILAQHDASRGGENRWEAIADDTLCWPYGIALDEDRLAVADSGNNRVVVWRRDGGGDRDLDRAGG